MNENSITILINNYKGKQVLYTMPESAIIEQTCYHTRHEDGISETKEIHLHITCPQGIDIEVEEIVE